ncbi:opine dehydrogenase [Lingula anatina]|uniref:Opine dehydrogenase n=1 Tax=Lingula anatina TaxID=7574 RepID=A0A1S3JK90_LINAN|nr:opine dehydrogenase [Lingula anatina]XP_013410792.1 opine dehydrogenase [Lingula anatina]|eukprot:XP_013410791.1 opine dehydrogenase [Lingula anatina]
MSDKFQVLVCGGGNGAHVMAGLAAAKPDIEARVLTLFADEADQWSESLKTNDLTVLVKGSDGQPDTAIKSKPSMVSKKPEEVVPGCKMIIIVVPAFAHNLYLEAIKPYVDPKCIILGVPGPSFDHAVRGILGEKADTVFIFETLPWACRIKEYGKEVEVLGSKETVLVAIQGSLSTAPIGPMGKSPVETLQYVLGAAPVLHLAGHPLCITLMATPTLHSAIMYGTWTNWDGKPLDKIPLFYQGVNETTAQLISDLSDENLKVTKGIKRKRPDVDLSQVKHVYDWFMTRYTNDVQDKSSLKTVLQTNNAYAGLKHSMLEVEPGKFVPDFSHRYISEDIPFGLVVTRGVAEVAGIETPIMDKILLWAQEKLGKEFLVNGKMQGKDIYSTQCPQAYGLKTLDEVLGH